jgi:drug/metabolite transporter (DMT)-like permease
MWQVFLMYALFGSIFSVGKIGIAASQPYFLTGMRMFLAGILMLGYFYWHSPKNLIIQKSDWGLLFLVAFFNVFITNAFEFWGLQYMSAGKTCLIYSFSPFAAAFIAYFFGTEEMTWKKWLGLFVGFLSFCPMMLEPWMTSEANDTDSMELLAEGALIISAITAVIGWTFVRKLTIEKNTPHALVNGASFLLAAGMCLLTSFSIETWNPVPVLDWPDFFFCLIYIVLIHNIICYSIYAASLERFSITFMAFAGLSNPLFAACFGWLFLGEKMTTAFWLALIGVFFGLYLFYREEKTSVQNHGKKPLRQSS